MKKVFIGCMAASAVFFCHSKRENQENNETTDHRIIVMFSTPRSLSTAKARMWGAHGDFSIMNEPCATVGMVDRLGIKPDAPLPKHLRPDSPRTFQGVKDLIFKEALTSSVLVKEIHGAMHYYYDNPEMMKNPAIRYLILVRNPHHMFISLYKKQIKIDPGYSESPTQCRLLSEESKRRFLSMPYRYLYESAKIIAARTHRPLTVVKSEDLCSNPEQTAQKLCERLDVPFRPSMLQWEKLDAHFSGVKEWHEQKQPQSLHFWHDVAINSTGFKQPSQYEVDDEGRPTFNEIKNPHDRAFCKKAYNDNLPYYHALLRETEWAL